MPLSKLGMADHDTSGWHIHAPRECMTPESRTENAVLREAGFGDLRGCSGWLASLASGRVQSSDLTRVSLPSHLVVTLPTPGGLFKVLSQTSIMYFASATHLDSSLKVCLDLTQVCRWGWGSISTFKFQPHQLGTEQCP